MTMLSEPIDTAASNHYQNTVRNENSRNNWGGATGSGGGGGWDSNQNDMMMQQPSQQQQHAPSKRKRMRATKRRLRQPLSGPAGIWFRLSKRAADEKDCKAGIVKAEGPRASSGHTPNGNGDDNAFDFEESAAVATHAFNVMTQRSKELQEEKEEERGGDNGDNDAAKDEFYDEETGQCTKISRRSSSNVVDAMLGRAWDAMCVSMDRIVPEPSLLLSGKRRQPYHEIRSALDTRNNGKLAHFALLSEVIGRDGSRANGAAGGGVGDTLRVGHIVVSVASVHCHGHCDWTVELRDESLAATDVRNEGSGGGSQGGMTAWVEAQLVKDRPEWVRPGVVWYLRDAAVTVFAGGGGSQNSSFLASSGNIERMLLISESSVVCAWTPESHMDGNDYNTLVEDRAKARGDIKEEEGEQGCVDLSQERDDGAGPLIKNSPTVSSRVQLNHGKIRTKPTNTRLGGPTDLTSDSQEDEGKEISAGCSVPSALTNISDEAPPEEQCVDGGVGTDATPSPIQQQQQEKEQQQQRQGSSPSNPYATRSQRQQNSDAASVPSSGATSSAGAPTETSASPQDSPSRQGNGATVLLQGTAPDGNNPDEEAVLGTAASSLSNRAVNAAVNTAVAPASTASIAAVVNPYQGAKTDSSTTVAPFVPTPSKTEIPSGVVADVVSKSNVSNARRSQEKGPVAIESSLHAPSTTNQMNTTTGLQIDSRATDASNAVKAPALSIWATGADGGGGENESNTTFSLSSTQDDAISPKPTPRVKDIATVTGGDGSSSNGAADGMPPPPPCARIKWRWSRCQYKQYIFQRVQRHVWRFRRRRGRGLLESS